jgi:hypothetical protein
MTANKSLQNIKVHRLLHQLNTQSQLIQILKAYLRHVSAQVYLLQGGPNAILKKELLLGKLLFINSLADGGALLIAAFQQHFIFKTGIFCSLKMVHTLVPKHVGEAPLTFVSIKPVHLVCVINSAL